MTFSKGVWGIIWMSWGKRRKYQTFSVLIKKESWKVDKDGNEDIIKILHKIKFIDSARFIVRSLTNLVNNLIEFIELNEKIVTVFSNMKVLRTI